MTLATAFLAATSSLAFAQGPMPTSHAWAPASSSEGMIPACPPGGMMPGYGPACPPGYGGPPAQLVQPDIFYGDDSPIDLVIRETLRRSWVRVEYLNWNIQDPGTHLLGARTATVDPRTPFQAFDPGNIPRVGVDAVVPDTGSFGFDNLPAMRLTVGAPTEWGSFEADIFAALTGKTSIDANPVFVPALAATVIPAVTLTVNGAPSDSAMVLFDAGYHAEMRSSMWGSQFNWIGNPVTPQNTLVVAPVAGIRYVKFQEDLQIFGTDTTTGTSPHISSKSNNNIAGPQLGLRASIDSKWLSLGLEPKVLFGINQHQDSVKATQIFDVGNNVFTTNKDMDFAPAFNMPGYAKLHLTENFSLFAGYELLWLSKISRPAQNIVYDSPALATDPPQIRLQKQHDTLLVHGLMVGAEFQFR